MQHEKNTLKFIFHFSGIEIQHVSENEQPVKIMITTYYNILKVYVQNVFPLYAHCIFSSLQDVFNQATKWSSSIIIDTSSKRHISMWFSDKSSENYNSWVMAVMLHCKQTMNDDA